MEWAHDMILILGVHLEGAGLSNIRVMRVQLEEEATYVTLRVLGTTEVRNIAVSDFLFADNSGVHTLH